ncbi:MAG: 5'-methylthioadenosine/S-adenosylhomocysteine nucleosidase [Corynebacterium sp.]|nr:5'-methylthioadenosine/S-adenosylhomocysteine nucleosidase [Corynebacterium sp.]
MERVHAIVSVAMVEEAAPFLAHCDYKELGVRGGAQFYLLKRENQLPVLLIQSGIGLACAAGALAYALTQFETETVISAGTCGGLGRAVEVGDICVSTTIAYTDVDATAFGYERGQNPGQPARFESPRALTSAMRVAAEAVRATKGEELAKQQIHTGQMLAGNSFVTAHNVKDTREAFPEAISTDMETVALAQLCHAYGLSFVSVRSASDLCGPEAGQDFHMDSGLAAARSADVVCAWAEI